MTGIVYIAAIFAAALHAGIAQRYDPFPSNCTCGIKPKPPASAQCGGKISLSPRDPDRYPAYDDMGFSDECLPSVPANHRMCYTMGVHRCRDTTRHAAYYHCRLFDHIGKNSTAFGLHPLPVSGNASFMAVNIKSIQRHHKRIGSVCFYNISLNENANCSAIKLQHIVDYPEDQYVDGLEETATNSTSTLCRSHVNVYYGSEETQQFQTLCREDLATFNDVFLGSSLFIAHWMKNVNNDGSFHLQAQCIG